MQPVLTSTAESRVNMQGLIVIHVFLLSFFAIRASSSIARLVTPRDSLVTSPDMRISTYNLRFDSMPDNITVQQTLSNLSDPLVAPTYLGLLGEQPWSTRRIKVAQHLLHSGVVMASKCLIVACEFYLHINWHMAGFQEALVRQVNDLAELLGNDWAWVCEPMTMTSQI